LGEELRERRYWHFAQLMWSGKNCLNVFVVQFGEWGFDEGKYNTIGRIRRTEPGDDAIIRG